MIALVAAASADPVWVVEGAIPYDAGLTRTCAPAPNGTTPLPAGLRGEPSPAGGCGPEWVFVSFAVPGYPRNRANGYYLRAADVKDSPPKTAWDRARAQATRFVGQAGDSPTIAIPLDEPRWTAPLYLSAGETVEVLEPTRGVVRTSTGREAQVDPYYLREQDPVADGGGDWQDSVAVRRRFHAGRPAHPDLVPLPPAGALVKGVPYVFFLREEWLRDARHSPEWFDPVGHTLEHACRPDPRPFEPCGTYRLDYTAFGAWWPDRETYVVGVWDGKDLDVVVMEPWSGRIAVGEGW